MGFRGIDKSLQTPYYLGVLRSVLEPAGAVSNDFEGPVFRRHPRLGEIRAGLLKRGAADAALAGSGSAVFGVFRNPAQARRAARAFPEDSVFVAKPSPGKNMAAL